MSVGFELTGCIRYVDRGDGGAESESAEEHDRVLGTVGQSHRYHVPLADAQLP